MSRIKVFYFLPNLQQGGPERQVLELINRLPKRFEPVLCLYHDNIFFRRELPADQPRHVLGVESMNLSAFAKLRAIIREERPEIVHSYRDKSNFWCRLAALSEGVPVIISACRNRAMQLRYLLVEKALSDRCQLILTNSEGVREELTGIARVNPDRIRVIYNFLDLELFRLPSHAERKEAREHWDLRKGQRALLLPGRICFQKHQIGLLLALDDLARAGRLPEDMVLLLAGRRRDPRISRWVDGIAERPSLRNRVRFLGAQTDMRSLYWAADILVMPSLYEGLSNAALEAGACGMPQILSRAANADQTIVHGETGLEVPTGHRHALATAMDALIHLDGAELRRMGRRGREHIARRFASSESVVIDQMVEVYDGLLAEAGIVNTG